MKAKVIVTINAEFGSEFQEEFFLQVINAMMKGLKLSMENNHKKNKMEFKIEGEDS